MNLYGYVGNSPINLMDPSGLWAYFQPSTWFDGKGYQPGIFENDIGEASQATLDGIIPFADPFGDNDGYNKCDSGLAFSRGSGAFSRDVYLGARIPNLTSWLKNPILYEAGSVTVPTRVFNMIEGLSSTWRGRWLGAFGETFGSYGTRELALAYAKTWNTGFTPLGRIVTLGIGSYTDYFYRSEGKNTGDAVSVWEGWLKP